jgi:DNA invertase Pin-like site-specific DNA recombinase
MTEAKRAVIWCAVSTVAQVDDDRDSLPAQERNARLIAEQNGWQVIDTLTVPGHSRYYTQLYECAADMRAAGIDALDRLITHWKQQDFDVLICRDGNRFARTQAMHAAVVEEIIHSGAQIHSMADGIINAGNFRMWIAMNGYKAASEIDELKRKRAEGMQHRFYERHLPAKLPVSHRLVRDTQSGKVTGIELNPDYALLWQDTAALLLEGVVWYKLEEELYKRFGHVNPSTRQPFGKGVLRQAILTPTFWGHLARNHTRQGNGSKHTRRRTDGLHWTYDDTVAPAAGIDLIRHCEDIPPVWTGELRQRVVDELRRRRGQQGRAYSRDTHRFSGLSICGVCGHAMSTHISKGNRRRVFCSNRTCVNRRMVNYADIQAYIHAILERALARHDGAVFVDAQDEAADGTLSALYAKREQLNKQIERMLVEQSLAADGLQAQYRTMLSRLNSEHSDVTRRIAEIEQAQQRVQSRQHSTLQALDDIRAVGLDDFWQQPEQRINQALHRLFGMKRLVVLNGRVVRPADGTRQRHQ